MNTRKQICRFLGIFSSLVMIVSMFLPFFNDTNLWETLNQSFDVYIRYAVLSFSALSLFVYLLNKKVEFSYISCGSILFFIFMRTLTLMELGYFDFVQIGYYCLLASTLLTILITFIYNIKSKYEKDELVMEIKDTQVYQPSMMMPKQETIQPQSLVPNIIQPQITNPVNQIMQQAYVQQQPQPNYNVSAVQGQTLVNMENQQSFSPAAPVQPVIQTPQIAPVPQVVQNSQNYSLESQQPVLADMQPMSQVVVPVMQTMNSVSASPLEPPINPTIEQPIFDEVNNIPTMQPMQSMQLLNREEPEKQNLNPVVSTFMNLSEPSTPTVQPNQVPLEPIPQIQNNNANNGANNSLDIFNQPMR